MVGQEALRSLYLTDARQGHCSLGRRHRGLHHDVLDILNDHRTGRSNGSPEGMNFAPSRSSVPAGGSPVPAHRVRILFHAGGETPLPVRPSSINSTSSH